MLLFSLFYERLKIVIKMQHKCLPTMQTICVCSDERTITLLTDFPFPVLTPFASLSQSQCLTKINLPALILGFLHPLKTMFHLSLILIVIGPLLYENDAICPVITRARKQLSWKPVRWLIRGEFVRNTHPWISKTFSFNETLHFDRRLSSPARRQPVAAITLRRKTQS